LGVFNGTHTGPAPVSVRLDLWHADVVSRGENDLPQAVRGMCAPEVEDYLGFARAARYRANVRLAFADAEFRVTGDSERQLEEYCLPGGTLVRETRRSADMVRQGLGGHITRYPVQSPADLRVLLDCVGRAKVALELGEYRQFDVATGDAGLPLLVAGPCPAHTIMLRFTGYEQFYYLLADCRSEVEKLCSALDKVFRRDLWPALQTSGAAIILHGAHFSSQMTPPPLFDRFFLPYFTDFNAAMHEARIRVLWHADAEMGDLLQHALDAGFDGADCLASVPLVPQTMEDYFDAWQGRIVCWGGLPSVIFDPTFPVELYQRFVTETVAAAGSRTDCILGASDNVMPGAEWERLLFLSAAAGAVPRNA